MTDTRKKSLHKQLYERVVISRNKKDWVHIPFGIFGGYLGWQFISIFFYHSFPNPINIILGFLGGYLFGRKLQRRWVALYVVIISFLISAIGSVVIGTNRY